jgi:autophagy-related protein 11
MSIQLFIGHSGQRLALDSTVTSLDGLRAWVAQHAGIQARSQVLLTAQGKQVRQQTLLTETELFVFDSKLFASKEPVSLPGIDALEKVAPYNPGTPPDTIANQNDLQAWQTLFRLRKSWASALLGGCSKLATQAEEYLDEEAVIARSLGVAVASLQQHIKSGEKKYNSVVAWADDELRDREEHVHGWERNLDSLRSVPARPEFARFLNPVSPVARRSSQQADTANLQVFVDLAKTRRSAHAARDITEDLTERLNGLQARLEDATKRTDELLQAVDQVNNDTRSYIEAESEASQLRNEIDIVVNKISSDFEHVQSLPRTSQSAVQSSKMALLHTRNYLPNLSEYCQEMNELVGRARERRQQVALSALEHMQTLSSIESLLSQLYAGIESFGIPEEDEQSFTVLTLVGRIPSVYGQLLVESVRRREWVAKMKRDSSTLQEEMATYQEEEEKRRKKWIHSVQDVVNMDALQSSRVLGIELSMQNEGGSWPMVTREELQEYLNTLLQVYGEGPVAEEMELAIKDLDKPTRKQIKHAKAFKNGSMHEAAFGDTSLMLRGDEQFKSLRDMNGRLEDELKGQKSRVRKLEDLLHRSTQMSRGSTDMFSPQSISRNLTPPLASSPQPSSELSRNGSIKHRRLSSTAQGIEEKKLARRVVDLEAELHAAKEEAKSRKNSDAEAAKQVEEAVSTKKDLMENMEAQQKEFAGERRNLEAELRDAKYKLEEAETEIERLIGSRDDERSSIDGKVSTLEDEVARHKQDAAGHAARAANEHDARSKLERKLEIESGARASVEEQLQRMKMVQEERREAEADYHERLSTAHAQLSPNAEAPNGIAGLATALEELSRRSAAHAKDLADAVAFAKSENETLQANNDAQKSEIAKAKDTQAGSNEQARHLQDRLSAEEAKVASLHQQLEDEQNQLKTLRNKFAEGETGSGVLRQRVAEEETKVVRLSSQLAESQSHANSLDVELTRLQKQQQIAQASADTHLERLEKRAGRAKEISQKLYSQHARFSRLLERLGLAISYQDDAMVIERASKLGASTITDQGRASMITSPPPTRKSSNADETMDLSIIRWADAQSAEDETAQYANFLENINRFNVDTFAEAVVKRVRDFEYTARKYNKEQKEAVKRAEAYKDRAQRLRSEANTKIAVRDFKEGDMALFLPTRGQAKGAWAAFNIGCPHYFLAEREGMRLGSRDFIVARITKVEQKVVDLSKTLPQHSADGRSIDENSEAPSYIDDNPFELSDGLTWWMVHATEERGPGAAPTTPGLGKSTVAAANVDARGSIKLKRTSKGDDASKHLNKSLDSRRSSSTSKKGVLAVLGGAGSTNMSADGTARPRSDSQSSTRPGPATGPVPASGLGIVTQVDGAEDESTDANVQPTSPHKPLPLPIATHRRASEQADPFTQASTSASSSQPISPGTGTGNGRQALRPPQPRSSSPSKSIRSLQKHLDAQGSPVRKMSSSNAAAVAVASPAKQQSGGGGGGSANAKPGWESLWSAEYSLESPGKKK